MKPENYKKLKEIFMEIFSINESEIESYRKLNNRKWDSIASVTLIAAVESEFNVVIDDSDYESFSSFAAVELALENLNV